MWVRFAVVVYLVITLWLSAMIVHRLNLDAGGWVLLIGMVNASLLPASMKNFGRRRASYHMTVLVATFAVFLHVDRTSAWKATCEVRTGNEVFMFMDGTRYYSPAATPNRFPFAAVNDVWAIGGTQDVDCLITWTGPSDTITVRSGSASLFISRRNDPVPHATGDGAIPLVALVLISLAALVEIARHFGRDMRWSWAFLRTGKAAALFFVFGALMATVQLVPSEWLSNSFLSRGDDWLTYEKCARQILAGNVLLMPPPGDIEMWSALYPYLVAVMHFLFGPSLGALYVITHGLHGVLIWTMLMLLSQKNIALALATAMGTLLFVSVDLNLHYAWRLLSDTWPLVLLPLVLVAWKRGSDPRVLGLLCGTLYLMRVELLGIGPLLLAFILVYDRAKMDRLRIAGFSIMFLLCVAPYMARHYALFGDPMPWPLGMGASGHLHWRTLLSPDFLILKAKAIMGHYGVLNPDLRLRFHWMFVHGLFLLALIATIRERLTDRYIGFALVAWLYVFLTRMASPSIGAYGHRHSLLLILLEMIVIVLVAERYLEKQRTATP